MRVADQLQRVGEVERGIVAGTSGRATSSRLSDAAACVADRGEHAARAPTSARRITVAVVVDEAHLGVERDVLVEVARVSCGSARKTGPDLEDALEHADHDLLVELRALREVRRPAEVVDLRRRWRRPRSPLPTIFGVWISVKSMRVERRRGSRVSEAAASCQSARRCGCRSVTRRVVEQRRQLGVQRRGGRDRTGGGSVAAEITSTVRLVDLDAAGACGRSTTTRLRRRRTDSA